MQHAAWEAERWVCGRGRDRVRDAHAQLGGSFSSEDKVPPVRLSQSRFKESATPPATSLYAHQALSDVGAHRVNAVPSSQTRASRRVLEQEGKALPWNDKSINEDTCLFVRRAGRRSPKAREEGMKSGYFKVGKYWVGQKVHLVFSIKDTFFIFTDNFTDLDILRCQLSLTIGF